MEPQHKIKGVPRK